MKHLLLFALTFALITPPPAIAQFQPSSLPETLIPGSQNPGSHINRVANYSFGGLSFGAVACDLYVSTWTMWQPTFYYKRTMANNSSIVLDEGMISIPGASYIFDVVILKNPVIGAPNAYCVAVVWKGSSGGWISFYEWTPTGLILSGQNLFTSDDINAMNMDALDLTYYSVVYSTLPNNVMYAFGGDVLGGLYPLVGPVKQINGNAPSGTEGYLPNIAMTMLDNPPPNMSVTGIKNYYAYISPDKDECRVSYLGFDELMAYPSPIGLTHEHLVQPMTFIGVPSSCIMLYSPLPRYFYSFGPTIDAPDYSNDSWSVIVEQEEFYPLLNCTPFLPANELIQLQVSAAYKISGAPVQDIVLNDGSIPGTVDLSKNLTPPFDSILRASQPAVAFSGIDPTTDFWINYGWGKTQEYAPIDSFDYIGMVYDPLGNVPFYAPGGQAYRIIDYDPVLNPYIYGIAFSGHNITTNNLYTVFIADTVNNNPPPNYWSESVYQKHPLLTNIIPWGYKPTAIKDMPKKTLQIKVQPNPFENHFSLSVSGAHQNDIFEVSLTDILGRQILHAKGRIESINQSIRQNLSLLNGLSSSLYLLHVKSVTAQQEVTFKLIKK